MPPGKSGGKSRVGPILDKELGLSDKILFAQIMPNLIIVDAILVIWLNSPMLACQLDKRLFTNAEMTSTVSRHFTNLKYELKYFMASAENNFFIVSDLEFWLWGHFARQYVNGGNECLSFQLLYTHVFPIFVQMGV